ncbi:response regulator [Halosolutus gelatinilyticus]|uniref:response regulator n=1 Tax=Halosolutus gelatinilyticus TaxID=2931975 RepID=UPI001FF127DA|nr:response regulator [Halosolutus gelatinilyticus]
MSHLQRSADPVHVLIAEDNPGDVRLIEESFEMIDCEAVLHTVADGYEALYFLKRRSTVESPPLPDLALVDLDLPGKDGCDVLEAIRDDPQLRRLPVIMLTGSDDERDIARCYDAHANAYVTKPTDPGEFVSLVEGIEQFWFHSVQLPSIPR